MTWPALFPKMPWRFGPCFELPPASTVWQALHLRGDTIDATALVDGVEVSLARRGVSSTAWRRLHLITGLSRAPRRPAGARGTDGSEEQRRLQY